MKQKKIKNYEYIKDGEVLIKPDLNCWEDDLSYWEEQQ